MPKDQQGIKVGIIDTVPVPPRTGGEGVLLNIYEILEANFDCIRYRFALNTEGSVLLYPFYPLLKPLAEHLRRRVDVLFASWSGALPVAADMIYLQPPAVLSSDPSSLKARLGLGKKSPRNLWPTPLMWLYYNRPMRWLLDSAAYRALDRVGTILVSSQHVQAELAAELNRNSTVIYPSLSRDSYALFSTAPPFSKKTRQVVTISRLVPEKRLETVAEIANHLPDIKFVLAGREGETSRQYLPKLKSLNTAGNLEILNSISEREKVALLRASSAFLNTSENEGFLLTPVEALLAGTYPVVFASGGPTDYLPAEHLFSSVNEAIEKLRDAVSGNRLIGPDISREARRLADPARFESEIITATLEAASSRRP